MTLVRRVQGWIDANVSNKRKVLVHYSCDKLPGRPTNETISFSTGGHQLTMKWKPIEAIISKERGYRWKQFHFIVDESDTFIPVDWIEDWLHEHGQSTEMLEDWKSEEAELYTEAGIFNEN